MDLPNEICFFIIEFLDLKSYFRFALCSRRCKLLADLKSEQTKIKEFIIKRTHCLKVSTLLWEMFQNSFYEKDYPCMFLLVDVLQKDSGLFGAMAKPISLCGSYELVARFFDRFKANMEDYEGYIVTHSAASGSIILLEKVHLMLSVEESLFLKHSLVGCYYSGAIDVLIWLINKYKCKDLIKDRIDMLMDKAKQGKRTNNPYFIYKHEECINLTLSLFN